MKLQSWAVLILVVLTAGCAVSDKSPSADNFAGTSPNGQGGLIGGGAEDSFTDEEFDLLEEELDEGQVKIDDPLKALIG